MVLAAPKCRDTKRRTKQQSKCKEITEKDGSERERGGKDGVGGGRGRREGRREGRIETETKTDFLDFDTSERGMEGGWERGEMIVILDTAVTLQENERERWTREDVWRM